MSRARVLMGAIVISGLAATAGPLLTPVQVGNLLKMTNGNVRIEYDLNSGRANFYWQNNLKLAGFYAGYGLYANDVLTNYVTGTVYTNRSWTVNSNIVEITSTRGDLPTLKQSFILEEDNSFLTRLEATGSGLQSRRMGPVVMDPTNPAVFFRLTYP